MAPFGTSEPAATPDSAPQGAALKANNDQAAACNPDPPLSEAMKARAGRHPPIGSGRRNRSRNARPAAAAASPPSASPPDLGIDAAPVDATLAMSGNDWREAAMDEMFGPAMPAATAADDATPPSPATDAALAAASAPPPVADDDIAAGAAPAAGASAARNSVVFRAPDEWQRTEGSLQAKIDAAMAAKAETPEAAEAAGAAEEAPAPLAWPWEWLMSYADAPAGAEQSPTPAGIPDNCSWTTRKSESDSEDGWGSPASPEAEAAAGAVNAPAGAGANYPLDSPYPMWMQPGSIWQPPPPPVAAGAGGPVAMGVLPPYNEEARMVAACVSKPPGMSEAEYLRLILGI